MGVTKSARATNGEAKAEQLSQDRIIDAALRVAKRVGFDRLTMRALADELGVTPMAAYYYVKSKDELLELVADSVAAGRAAVAARSRVGRTTQASGVRPLRPAHRVPGLGAFLLERPLTPSVRKTYWSGVEIFRRAGLDEHEAELAHATYHTFMFGLMGMEYRFRPVKQSRGRDDEAVVAHATTHEFIEFGLDTIIAGIRARQHS